MFPSSSTSATPSVASRCGSTSVMSLLASSWWNGMSDQKPYWWPLTLAIHHHQSALTTLYEDLAICYWLVQLTFAAGCLFLQTTTGAKPQSYDSLIGPTSEPMVFYSRRSLITLSRSSVSVHFHCFQSFHRLTFHLASALDNDSVLKQMQYYSPPSLNMDTFL